MFIVASRARPHFILYSWARPFVPFKASADEDRTAHGRVVIPTKGSSHLTEGCAKVQIVGGRGARNVQKRAGLTDFHLRDNKDA